MYMSLVKSVASGWYLSRKRSFSALKSCGLLPGIVAGSPTTFPRRPSGYARPIVPGDKLHIPQACARSIRQGIAVSGRGPPRAFPEQLPRVTRCKDNGLGAKHLNRTSSDIETHRPADPSIVQHELGDDHLVDNANSLPQDLGNQAVAEDRRRIEPCGHDHPREGMPSCRQSAEVVVGVTIERHAKSLQVEDRSAIDLTHEPSHMSKVVELMPTLEHVPNEPLWLVGGLENSSQAPLSGGCNPCPPQESLIDEENIGPQVLGPDGRDAPSRTSADDEHVGFVRQCHFISQGYPPSSHSPRCGIRLGDGFDTASGDRPRTFRPAPEYRVCFTAFTSGLSRCSPRSKGREDPQGSSRP